MKNHKNGARPAGRLTLLAASLLAAGSLSGCGGDDSKPQTSVSVDVYGARGGTLTALTSSSNCNEDVRITWSNGGVGPTVEDSDPSRPLTAMAICGSANQSQTLAAQNVFASSSAFAVLGADGSLAVWGSPRLGGDTSALKTQPQNVKKVVFSERAAVALQADGTLVGWGRGGSGGLFSGPVGVAGTDSTAPIAPLGEVVDIWPTKRGMVALNKDGTATTWGNIEDPRDGNGASKAMSAFFATVDDAKKLRDVQNVVYNAGAVAVLKKDGTAMSWGYLLSGGNGTADLVADKLQDVVSITATDYNFAALKKDGSVVAWGVDWENQKLFESADFAKAGWPQKVGKLISNLHVLVAHGVDGALAMLGGGKAFDRGLDTTGLDLSNVRKVVASKTAFAAIKNDGSVATWGDGDRNDPSVVLSKLTKVKSIASTELAFAALKEDGTVVTWGDDLTGGDSSAVAAQLNQVVALFANDYAFAALKSDGTVVTWGAAAHGGDSSAVAGQLKNIRAIYGSALGGFLAVAKDGSFVTWGSDSAGGGKTPAALSKIPYLKS